MAKFVFKYIMNITVKYSLYDLFTYKVYASWVCEDNILKWHVWCNE